GADAVRARFGAASESAIESLAIERLDGKTVAFTDDKILLVARKGYYRPDMARRAVVCEDDAMLRHVIESVRRGVDVECIAEGDSVPSLMEVILHGEPDIVVLDLIVLGTTEISEAL